MAMLVYRSVHEWLIFMGSIRSFFPFVPWESIMVLRSDVSLKARFLVPVVPVGQRQFTTRNKGLMFGLIKGNQWLINP